MFYEMVFPTYYIFIFGLKSNILEGCPGEKLNFSFKRESHWIVNVAILEGLYVVLLEHTWGKLHLNFMKDELN